MAKRTKATSASSPTPDRSGRTDRGGRAGASTETPVGHQPSIVEQDGAFFWRDQENDALVGPFRTRQAAVADRDSPGPQDDDLVETVDADAVHDAEAEIGIDDFIDPDTGEPTHGYEPQVRDDH